MFCHFECTDCYVLFRLNNTQFVIAVPVLSASFILWKTADKCGRYSYNYGCGDLENVDVVAAIVVAHRFLKPLISFYLIFDNSILDMYYSCWWNRLSGLWTFSEVKIIVFVEGDE